MSPSGGPELPGTGRAGTGPAGTSQAGTGHGRTGLWVASAEDPRVERSTHGERDTVLSYLDDYRVTFQLKCAGLSPKQLAKRSVQTSTGP
ncbi:MAG: hypothetical protein WAW88_13695 [Nocardioides sp.]